MKILLFSYNQAKDWDLKYNRVKTMNATECRRVSGPNAPVHMPITLCAYSDDVSSGTVN